MTGSSYMTEFPARKNRETSASVRLRAGMGIQALLEKPALARLDL